MIDIREEEKKLLQMTQTLNKIYYGNILAINFLILMKFIYFWRNTTYKNLDKKGVDNLNRLVSNLKIILRELLSAKKLLQRKLQPYALTRKFNKN